MDCAKAREKIIFLKRCLKDILLPSNHHKRFDLDLLLEQQLRKVSTDLKIMSNRARCDPSFWHNLSEHNRREVYRLRHLTKLKYIEKFNWLRSKQDRSHSNLKFSNKINKSGCHNKNVRDRKRCRRRQKQKKIQATSKETFDMIRNKSDIELDQYDKEVLSKGLNFAPTPAWGRSVENNEWHNAYQHIRREEWRALLGDESEMSNPLQKKLKIPKNSAT